MKRIWWGTLACAVGLAGCGGSGNSLLVPTASGPTSIPVTATSTPAGVLVSVGPLTSTPAKVVAIASDTTTGTASNNIVLQPSGSLFTGIIPNALSAPSDSFIVIVTTYDANGNALGSTTQSFGTASATGNTTGVTTGIVTGSTIGVTTGVVTTGSTTATTTSATTGTTTAST